jgi:hypothetical protein
MDIQDHCRLSKRIDVWIAAEATTKREDSETIRALAAAVAFGSKLVCYALMSLDLEFISKEQQDPFAAEIVEVKKMLQGFKRSIQTSQKLS